MRPVVSRLEATLRKVPDAVNVAPRTVVAIPPSDIDTPGLMRVLVGEVMVERAYDVEMVHP